MSRLQALFLLALLGILSAVGLVVSSFGWAALASYVGLVVVGLTLVAWRIRPARETEGRTCTCCTSTVYDPVEVR